MDKNSNEARPAFAPPKDRLLADVLLAHHDSVVHYFQHDTLLAHVEEEKLSEEELKDAWDEYEREKVFKFFIDVFVIFVVSGESTCHCIPSKQL